MTDEQLVAVVNAAALVSFFALLFVGAGSTLARVAYYRVWNFHRPRLLTRDLFLVGGFALSFGAILVVRALRAIGFDTAGLASNVWWSLGTALPALVGMAVYVYFEIWVIERGHDEMRDEMIRPPRPYDGDPS